MADARKQLKEKICPVCGKTFIFRDNWAYKIVKDTHVTNYCSWTCMRKVEKRTAGRRDNETIHGIQKVKNHA